MTDQELYRHHRLNLYALEPALRTAMVDVVKSRFEPVALVALRTLIAKEPLRWWVPHHLYFGMSVRNGLREAGYGEEALGIDNLDDYWVPIVEEAAR